MALIAVDEVTLHGAATDVRSEIALLRDATEYLAGARRFDALFLHVQASRFLHHRNLAEFLAGRPPDDENPDDDGRRTALVAAHYFPGHAWARPAMRLYNRESAKVNTRAREFLNRHLTHLTTARHRNRHAPKADWWHIVEPAAVLDGFDRFLEDLRAAGLEEHAEWFAIELAAARRVVGT